MWWEKKRDIKSFGCCRRLRAEAEGYRDMKATVGPPETSELQKAGRGPGRAEPLWLSVAGTVGVSRACWEARSPPAFRLSWLDFLVCV